MALCQHILRYCDKYGDYHTDPAYDGDIYQKQDHLDYLRDVAVTKETHTYLNHFKADVKCKYGYNDHTYWLMLIATIGLDWEDLPEFFNTQEQE